MQESITGTATFYNSSYNGSQMGCPPYNRYYATDPTIVATNNNSWPCGTILEITGPAGTTTVTRQDSCPGCAYNMVDLSEAANVIVCGDYPHTCTVEIRKL